MKKKIILIYSLTILIIAIIGYFGYTYFKESPTYIEISMKVNISENATLKLGTRTPTSFDFGTLNPKNPSTGKILIENHSPYWKKKIKGYIDGNISKVAYLDYNDTLFTLRPKSNKIISVHINPNQTGYFEGKLILEEIRSTTPP